MYNWVVRRVLERTSAPQAVYPQVVDAKVLTWMPAVALLAASFVTPARAKLDVRFYEWSPSPAGWMANIPVVPPTVAQRWPAIEGGQNRQFFTVARASLDVRRYDWHITPPNITARVDANVRTWEPAFGSELASVTTRDRGELDVRSYDWSPQPAWIFKNLPAAGPSTAQQWPAFESALHSYRTADKAPGLDVRGQQWAPDFGYTDASTTAIWTPIDNAVSGRTPDRQSFDVRRYEWAPSTLPGVAAVVDGVVKTWAPVFSSEIASVTTRDHADLDVRAYDWAPEPAWIFANLPVTVTQAQLWPAISEGTQANYRTIAARSLDVRSHDWAPEFVSPIGQLAPVIASWDPAFAAELASYRTGERARLEPRAYDWSPEPAFIFASLPAVATVAQTWPAIQGNLGTNYRTAERARLDVRRYDWRSDGPYTLAASNVIRTWAPVFSAELASFRTGIRPPLDVRIPSWLPTYTGQLLPTFRTWWAANSNQTIGPLQPQPESY